MKCKDAQRFASGLPSRSSVRPVGYYWRGSVPPEIGDEHMEEIGEQPTFTVGWSPGDGCYMATVEGAPPYVKAAGESAEAALSKLKQEIRLHKYIEDAWKER